MNMYIHLLLMHSYVQTMIHVFPAGFDYAPKEHHVYFNHAVLSDIWTALDAMYLIKVGVYAQCCIKVLPAR